MTMLTNPMNDIGIADAGIIAVLGYAVVFLGLILLLLVVFLIGKAMTKKAAEPEKTEEPVVEATNEAPAAPTAPGTAGELKLHDVEPKTAAMIMAIVADKLQKPLNELRFTSIKEVK